MIAGERAPPLLSFQMASTALQPTPDGHVMNRTSQTSESLSHSTEVEPLLVECYGQTHNSKRRALSLERRFEFLEGAV